MGNTEEIASAISLQTDYLVIGAGATAMAFADEIVRSSYRRVILVDRRARPGGHWNDAYPFVRLHQPSRYYGVNSAHLGAGGNTLASKAEILAYYEQVIEALCATGRVQFFGQCSYEGEGRFHSLVQEGLSYQVEVRHKIVDGTYSKITVPSTRPPEYNVADGVHLVPINGLAKVDRPWSRYVIIGAGKTGMDAVLFLLERGVDPDHIRWIISNDAWLFNRDHITPEAAAEGMPAQLRFFATAEREASFYEYFEREGWMFRLDDDVWPTKFRCATVSPEELVALRKVRDVVRMGRVVRIDPATIVLDRGELPTNADTLHVDCTADGLTRRPPRDVFEPDRITLQSVVMCQPVFSAAVIAMAEIRHGDDEATKNHRMRPVPHPEVPRDWFACNLTMFENMDQWKPYTWWLLRNRLSLASHMPPVGVGRLLLASLRWQKKAIANIRRIYATLSS